MGIRTVDPVFDPGPLQPHLSPRLTDGIEMNFMAGQAFLMTDLGQQRQGPQAGLQAEGPRRVLHDLPQPGPGRIVKGPLVVLAPRFLPGQAGQPVLVESMQHPPDLLAAQPNPGGYLADFQLLLGAHQDDLAAPHLPSVRGFQTSPQLAAFFFSKGMCVERFHMLILSKGAAFFNFNAPSSH